MVRNQVAKASQFAKMVHEKQTENKDFQLMIQHQTNESAKVAKLFYDQLSKKHIPLGALV